MLLYFNTKVDGCEILHHLKTVVYPIIHRVSTILLVMQDFFNSFHPHYDYRMEEIRMFISANLGGIIFHPMIFFHPQIG